MTIVVIKIPISLRICQYTSKKKIKKNHHSLEKLLPDIYKYHPLFLPLCGCQPAQAMGLFWVFSMGLASTFHIKALLTSWNTHKPVPLVVCHSDDLLKAAYVKPHVHIMAACLCSHTWIHQTSLLCRKMLNKCNIHFWKNPKLPIKIYICAASVLRQTLS